jgi:hypothetical protein
VRYLRNVVSAGTILASVTAVRYSLYLLILGLLLLAILAMGIVAVAAFSRRSAPMARLRALVRDLRGKERLASRRQPPGSRVRPLPSTGCRTAEPAQGSPDATLLIIPRQRRGLRTVRLCP